MELKWFEDFLSLCDTRNFRISSERQFISQPAFSRRIKALENWVGASLVDRSSQPVKLTSAGEMLKISALDIVQRVYQSRNDISTQVGEDESIIRFSTVSTLAQFFMPAWLKNLRPFIEVESFSVRTDFGDVSDYLSGLEEGDVDFFICYEDPSGTVGNYSEKFQSLLLGVESLVPVTCHDGEGKPAYWLPNCKPGSSIPYLCTNSIPSLWPIKNHLETRYAELEFIPVYETSIETGIRAMVIEGNGVAWIPKSIIAEDLENGLLVRAAEEEHDILLNIKIYHYEQSPDRRGDNFWQVLLEKDQN